MPLVIRWSSFTKDNVSRESDDYGVYELGNVTGVIYIGEGHVYSRLMSHFPDGTAPIVGASLYRVEFSGGKDRAKQRQNAELGAYKRRHGDYPHFYQRRG